MCHFLFPVVHYITGILVFCFVLYYHNVYHHVHYFNAPPILSVTNPTRPRIINLLLLLPPLSCHVYLELPLPSFPMLSSVTPSSCPIRFLHTPLHHSTLSYLSHLIRHHHAPPCSISSPSTISSPYHPILCYQIPPSPLLPLSPPCPSSWRGPQGPPPTYSG